MISPSHPTLKLGLSYLPQFKKKKYQMQQERFLRVPHISISATSITEYQRTFDLVTAKFLKPRRKDPLTGIEEEVQPPKFDKHIGGLSEKASRRLKRSINNLMLSVNDNMLITGEGKEKMSFITLTLPSPQIYFSDNQVYFYATDKEIKKAFNTFMTELKEVTPFQFVWVSEKQTNASLHFHILADKKFDKDKIQILWNRVINKYGFVDRYQQKMSKLSFEEYKQLRSKEKKQTPEKIQKAYDYGVKTNWTNPNSTDIARLKKVDNVSAYISKYMSKGHIENSKTKNYIAEISAKYQLNENDIKKMYTIEGRIWQCSHLVSRSRQCINILDYDYKNELDEFATKFKEKIKVFQDDYFSTLLLNYKQLKENLKSIHQYFSYHIEKSFNNLLFDDFSNDYSDFSASASRYIRSLRTT